MTDIVERLRLWPTVEVASVVERKLMNEAADEIERLRAALTYLVQECDPDMDEDYNPHAKPLAQARVALERKP